MSNSVSEIASRVIAELEYYADEVSQQFDPVNNLEHREILWREMEWNIKFAQVKCTSGVL